MDEATDLAGVETVLLLGVVSPLLLARLWLFEEEEENDDEVKELLMFPKRFDRLSRF